MRVTEEEKERIWEMHQAEVPVKRIARTIGRQNESLRVLISQSGGIRPRARVVSEGHLSLAEPEEISSGKQERDRLNRSGDRQANSALWHIVSTRMVNDPRTRHDIERRMKDGRTKKGAVRCLKRYVAREVFAALSRSAFGPLTIHRSIGIGWPISSRILRRS